jgi:prepilin-type N-terminal cleavage/methylation domain-containing protein
MRGFTFLELIVVMGAMAVLAAMAIGFIQNLGASTFLAQSRAILRSTAYQCLTASIGGRRSVLTLRRVERPGSNPVLEIGAVYSAPVLTHQFETLDFASEARSPTTQGAVTVLKGGGRVGNCARFQGGHLDFGAQTSFAMTEGLELDVWILPEPGHSRMTLVRGEDSYQVLLVQLGQQGRYDVRLQLKLRKASEGPEIPALMKGFETKGGPVVADGRWQHVHVMYDGLDPTIEVNGLDCEIPGRHARPAPGSAGKDAPPAPEVQRIAMPRRGAVALTISSDQSPYFGLMDSFHLGGIFRSDELERILPGDLQVLYPRLPLRIVFHDGGLDPDTHSGDQLVRIRDRRNPDDPPLRLTIGMFGAITCDFEKPGQGGPDVTNARLNALEHEQSNREPTKGGK